MTRSPGSDTFFHALAVFNFRGNRLYRVHVLADELVFIYVGSGGELAQAITLLGPMLCGEHLTPVIDFLANAIDPRSSVARRLRQLDNSTLDESIGDHKYNFRVKYSDLTNARLDPMSLSHAQVYSDPHHVGLFKFRHATLGRYRLSIPSVADMQMALKRLPLLLGDKLTVNVSWSEDQKRLLPKTRLEDFGNGLGVLMRVSLVGMTLLGIPLMCTILGFRWHDGLLTDFQSVIEVVIASLLITQIVPLMVLPTCLFSIRVADGTITHLLLGSIALSRHRVDDLTSIEVGRNANRPFAIVLRFSTGKRLRSCGMHLRTAQCLCAHLESIYPRGITVIWGG